MTIESLIDKILIVYVLFDLVVYKIIFEIMYIIKNNIKFYKLYQITKLPNYI